ncbi:ubiquitin carboxyl-terminal hydrolase 30 homolog isoform X1 [Neodiprion virginianus]|uniref:ubiquitin carboxyl-terminal hydrolase 30 homolog isoform X1 n=2 Tax=Neodiprion virginianus TaxID=2961670 RepID=UPI001EE72839|nr:ubiquitin carboxyl-terminal hydrolase 30 homolog isoform X1 [Neodiprion virginianus]
MDVEKIAMVAGVGFALVIGAFVLWGPSPRPRRRGQIIGLTNLGYTCFMNALLQSLAACPMFVGWLRTQLVNNENGQFARSLLSILDKVNGFCDEMIYGDVTPIEIITSLGPLWIFTPGHQDAHELFHVVLGALQAEMQPLNRKGCLSDALPKTDIPMTSDIRGSGDPFGMRTSVSCNDIARKDEARESDVHNTCLPDQMTASTKSIPKAFGSSIDGAKPGMIIARSSEVISRDGEGENSKAAFPFRAWNSLCTIPGPSIPAMSNVTHPFSGLLTSQLQCTNCNWKSSVHYDKFESVSLPLPPASNTLTWRRHTLAELLSRFVTSEVIHDVQCDGCGLRCPAVKTLTLGKLPKCLCLHIPRTTWGPSGVPVKRDDPIIFPEILILDPFTFTEAKKRNSQGKPQAMIGMLDQNSGIGRNRNRYKLQSVVEHRGPVDAGHFVSYRRGNRPGQWMYTSDVTVECTTLTDVLCASPYLLFYERINGS